MNPGKLSSIITSQKVSNTCHKKIIIIILSGLEFVFNECEIQPLTEKVIPVTLRPAKPATYTSNIFYQLVLTNEGTVHVHVCHTAHYNIIIVC